MPSLPPERQYAKLYLNADNCNIDRLDDSLIGVNKQLSLKNNQIKVVPRDAMLPFLRNGGKVTRRKIMKPKTKNDDDYDYVDLTDNQLKFPPQRICEDEDEVIAYLLKHKYPSDMIVAACERGDTEECMIALGATSPEHKDEIISLALPHAAERAVLEILIIHSNPNQRGHNVQLALQSAAVNGFAHACEFLITHYESVLKNEILPLALRCAAEKGHAEVCGTLLIYLDPEKNDENVQHAIRTAAVNGYAN